MTHFTTEDRRRSASTFCSFCSSVGSGKRRGIRAMYSTCSSADRVQFGNAITFTKNLRNHHCAFLWRYSLSINDCATILQCRSSILTCRRPRKIFRSAVNAVKSVIGQQPTPQINEKRNKETEEFKDALRKQINEVGDFEREINASKDRQLVMALGWTRILFTKLGWLRGTHWDPEDSHMIKFSDFLRLLNSKKIQVMEYSNYGKSVSVILPYDKDGKLAQPAGNMEGDIIFGHHLEKKTGEITFHSHPEGKPEEEIIFRRHVVDKMPVDCWNDVWHKLHEQVQHVNIRDVDPVSAQAYSSVAATVVWSMRLALAILVHIWIDNKMRPVYSRSSPVNVEDAETTEKPREIIKDDKLGSLGKSRAKFISAEETTGVTFDDFAGQEYIKKELQEVVRILRNDEEFQNKGIYCPKGVLLHGPPGTGKTLLARAIAGEAGLPFFAASGTDFVEMFIGVAAARVKDLFSTARSYAPSIIFIDEIDAIGSKRGGPDVGGGGAEREQGLLQILTQMDGFKQSTKQVLVIGATNRLDILDPALLRKGRFDKIIRVGLPSESGRLAILKVHARNKFFHTEEEKEVLLKEIAELTDDFTGAELQNILNEAGILAARKDLDYIGREEVLEALKRQKGTFETGQEDTKDMPEELKLRLAYREAAVAVLACYFPDPYRPFTETNISSAKEKPNMQYREFKGRIFSRRADYVNSIVRACAPRVIEEQMFGLDHLSSISATTTSDAAMLAEHLILHTGMTSFGNAYYRDHKDLVPNLTPKLEALRDEYIRFAVDKCSSVLKEYHAAVEAITDILIQSGTIKADDIWDIFKKSPRVHQLRVQPLDEYGALMCAGRWGIHGISLPGRITFAPGNMGFSTFGAPRPQETQIVKDETWKLVDDFMEQRPDIKQHLENDFIGDFKIVPGPKIDLLNFSHFL